MPDNPVSPSPAAVTNVAAACNSRAFDVSPVGMPKVPIAIDRITAEVVTERLSRALRRIVGPGRRWSYAAVAQRTGIDLRTLKAYVQGSACPNLVRYKRLLAALGPEIGQDLNVMQGMLPRRDASPPEALDLMALRRELTRATTTLSSVLGSPAMDARAGEVGPSTEAEAAGRDDGVGTRPEFRRPIRIDRINQAAIVARFSYRLRQMIGPGRRWSLASVAGETAIDARTLRSYVDGRACPNVARYLRLVQLLGPESGYELALMLGWQPRYRLPMRISPTALATLRSAIDEARAAIDAFIQSGDGRALVSPDDRLADDLPAAAGIEAKRAGLPEGRGRIAGSTGGDALRAPDECGAEAEPLLARRQS